MRGVIANGHNGPPSPVIKWYMWPLAPVAFLAAMLVILPLCIVALLSIPYFSLYPDHHAHVADCQGSQSEKARVARWRVTYSRMSFAGRVRRAMRRIARR